MPAVRFFLAFLYFVAVQYLLGYLTLKFTKHSEGGIKLAFTAFYGGIFALFSVIVGGCYRYALIGIGLVGIAVILSDRLELRAISAHFAIYGMAALCFLGAAWAAVFLLGERYRTYAPVVVCVGLMIALCLIQFAAHLGKKKIRTYCRVEAEGESGPIGARGYYDSGNVLYHRGLPVVVISERFAKRLGIGSEEEIAVGTVGGVQNLPLIPLTCKIYYGDHKNMLYHIYAAVSVRMNGRKYDILLHRDMGGNHEPTV